MIRYDYVESRTLIHFCYYANEIVDSSEKTGRDENENPYTPNVQYLAEQLYCEWREDWKAIKKRK
jgi:hypothetical protein